jgi:CheY-like chemotaxis protein
MSNFQFGTGIAMSEPILLHVEDEDAVALLLETVLHESAMQIRICRVIDGEEATAFLHRTGKYRSAPRPDLILLDLNLPRKTGFEVLIEIRDTPELRSLPVVIFTSSSHPADKRRSVELGALDFITKQSSLEGMTKAIQKACTYLPSRLSPPRP